MTSSPTLVGATSANLTTFATNETATTNVTSTTAGRWQPNVTLMITASSVIVFVAIGMACFILFDYIKKKKERRELAEEQADLEEAFNGAAKMPSANIYDVLWGKPNHSSKKKKTIEDEKAPLMSKQKSDEPSSPASDASKKTRSSGSEKKTEEHGQ